MSIVKGLTRQSKGLPLSEQFFSRLHGEQQSKLLNTQHFLNILCCPMNSLLFSAMFPFNQQGMEWGMSMFIPH